MTKTGDWSFFLLLLLCSMLMNALPCQADPKPATATPATSPADCPYPTAHDSPLTPAEKLVDTTPSYRQYRVEFNGIAGDRVPAFLYVPADPPAAPAVKHPAVLLQYGSGGNKSTNYIVLIGQRFVARGFVVLTIDVPGKGERKGGKGGIVNGNFLQTLGDYSRAVDYLVSRPEVDAGQIAYAGISWGAITGITFVAHDLRVKVMASMVGGGNFLGMLPVKPSDEALRDAKRFDPYYHVGLIAPRPLLLMNVTHDQLVPRLMSESLHRAAGEGAKKVWLDTDHIFSGLDRVAVAESVIDFVKEGLARKPK